MRRASLLATRSVSLHPLTASTQSSGEAMGTGWVAGSHRLSIERWQEVFQTTATGGNQPFRSWYLDAEIN